MSGGREEGLGEAQNRQTQTDGHATERGRGGWARWGLMISLPVTPSPRGDAELHGGNRNVTHTLDVGSGWT